MKNSGGMTVPLVCVIIDSVLEVQRCQAVDAQLEKGRIAPRHR